MWSTWRAVLFLAALPRCKAEERKEKGSTGSSCQGAVGELGQAVPSRGAGSAWLTLLWTGCTSRDTLKMLSWCSSAQGESAQGQVVDAWMELSSPQRAASELPQDPEAFVSPAPLGSLG